jgi:osmotically-inducible protein OsmY
LTAEQAALRVAGVQSIASEIIVDLSPASERTDGDIALAASNCLTWNSLVPDTVQLKITNGWVTLMGKTEWQFQREEAERVVRPLLGVKGISNEIPLTPNINIQTIKANIQDALKRGAQIDADNIQVETEGGTVTLRGNVQSWRERRAVEDAAFNAPGVAGVANLIAIGN